jgi:hypothetical protein
MVLEALFFVAGAAATVLVGTPIAASLAGPGELRSLHKRDKEQRKQQVRTEGGQRAFAPLDLGPDKVQWPSQRPWALTTTMKVPQWPSSSWTDEHFGKAARAANAAATAAAPATPRPDPKAATPVSQAPRQATPPRRRQTADAAQAAQKQQQTALEQMRRANPKGTQALSKTPPPPAPTTSPPARDAPPSEVEVEHLIATQGLAGTVQIIMQRTGWEFREAAQYLAQLRRNQ